MVGDFVPYPEATCSSVSKTPYGHTVGGVGVFCDSFLGHLPGCLIVQGWIMPVILVVSLLVGSGDFSASLFALQPGQEAGDGLAVKVTFASPGSSLQRLVET